MVKELVLLKHALYLITETESISVCKKSLNTVLSFQNL